jgi:hypothetical protein
VYDFADKALREFTVESIRRRQDTLDGLFAAQRDDRLLTPPDARLEPVPVRALNPSFWPRTMTPAHLRKVPGWLSI